MRVLFLRRQRYGGIATHCSTLAAALKSQGVEAILEDATDWIPDETGPKHDKRVSERLRMLSEPFDMVHAFGYRCAWACAEAFGHREAWIYTAYDFPKTTHRFLIDRLNESQAAVCSSNAVFRELDHVSAMDLVQIYPGVDAEAKAMERGRARRMLDLPLDSPVVGSLGPLVAERGHAALVAAMEHAWLRQPDATLAIAGNGPEEDRLREVATKLAKPDQVRVLGFVDDARAFLAAVDLVVVPASRLAFSLGAVEALAVGTPVLLRGSGGLTEITEPEISGFLFHSDEELGTRLSDLLDSPMTMDTVGAAGRLRCLERFGLEQCAENVVELYRGILEG